MKKKLLVITICLLLSLFYIGTISSATLKNKSIDYEPIIQDFSHTVLGEAFFNTTYTPCKYLHQALYQIFYEAWHPFYYITYLYDKNNNSNDRKFELNVTESPAIVMDGGYEKVSLVINSTELWKIKLNESIISCGARDVRDIDLSLDVEWQGAVNPYPEDGATDVPIETYLSCSISEMKIDVEATNNETSAYNGHIHVHVTEVNSSWWNDKFGNPYTFEFKDYAYNDDVQISAGETWNETIFWDGCDYNDGDDPPRYFDHIKQDNIMIIATAMNKDLNKWIDETEGMLAGVNTDPKTFDVYFGDTNPPPQVIMNTTVMKYDPPGQYLNWTTTYYWKVDVWNALGELLEGDVWSFTTRGNSPPNTPTQIPPDGSICGLLEWYGGDPDGDNVTYEIYFGEFDPSSDPPMIATVGPYPGNQTYIFYQLEEVLEFETKYEWKIVAWDQYGLNCTGEVWIFKTEPNYPPNPAGNPIPPDSAECVPVNAFLYWNGSDPNNCDTFIYDVYFGLNPNPPLVISKTSNNFYDPYGTGEMELFIDYYWRIDTYDSGGLMTPGYEWTFRTCKNSPPSDPEFDVPSRWPVGVELCINISSSDPDNHTIKYIIDWGDRTINETNYYESGESKEFCHTYETKGIYIIRIKAIDEYGEESNCSEFKIVIPRTRTTFNSFLVRFFNSFPLLERLLNLLR